MDSTPSIARRWAALEAMGFRREDATPLPTESTTLGGGRHKLTASRPAMGTLVSVTAIHASSGRLEDTIGRAFEKMEDVVRLLNRHDSASALSVLNDVGRISNPPPELQTVLREALSHTARSGRAFDATVQPLVDLFRLSRKGPDASISPKMSRSGATGSLATANATDWPGERGAAAARVPSPGEIRDLLALVDPRAVKLAPGRIHLEKPGMGVTLDGIAKGYVVDRMARVLRSSGVSDFLVDGGGDIRCAGAREDGRPWRVAVRNPKGDRVFPDVISLSDASVATSGSYEIFFDPQRTRHHIVSALDGSSPQRIQSVSVVAPSTMQADALATSVFLMDPARGTAYIDALPGCSCLIIDSRGEETRSARWRSAGDSNLLEAETP